MVKFTIGQVKEIIESKNCKLLQDYYDGNNKKLKILFSCGHEGYRTFAEFRSSDDPICRRCSDHETLSYKEVKDTLLKYRYEILDNTYIGVSKKISIKDSIGYMYYIKYCQFTNSIKIKSKFLKFEKNNPYSIHNISLWLSINYPFFKLVSDQKYIKKKDKLTFVDDEGYLYWLTMDNIDSNLHDNKKFNFVDSHNKYSIENIKLWLKKNNKDFYLLENQKYINRDSKLKFKCSVCKDDEYDFKKSWADIIGNDGCPYCTHRRVGKYTNLKYLFPEIAKEFDIKSNNGLLPENIPYSKNKKYWWICKNGHKYFASVNARTGVMKSGCPHCKKSKGENIVKEFLIDKNICFSEQFRFKDCKNIYALPFDFALFYDKDKMKLMSLIEYDGELHFKPRRSDGNSLTRLNNCQKRDKIKTEYCEKNNIKLLRIPYWDFKNIESILQREILAGEGGENFA